MLNQTSLFFEPGLGESKQYLSENLITYIGNKRALLSPIEHAVQQVQKELGRTHLRTMDAFSGSGVVARMLKQYSSHVYANDLEAYSKVINECFLANRSEVDLKTIDELIMELNEQVDDVDLPEGFIQRLYSPRNLLSIQKGERVFYTPDNARRIDNYRRLIELQEPTVRPFLLAPLLSQASIRTNTAGVFKGFYKDSATGIGKFGGSREYALERICGQIRLSTPALSNFESDWSVLSADVLDAVKAVEDLDLVYLDPPYNQHPYGSNYFMLNLICNYQEPSDLSEVSGIPNSWNRSSFNKRPLAAEAFHQLISATDSKYLLISYNSEGFISPDQMRKMLDDFGKTSEVQIQYNTYRGSRNLTSRDKYVIEHLFLVRKEK